MLLSYLRKLDLPFEVCNDNLLEEEFRAKASELIIIEDIPELSKMKLTFSGQQKGMSSSPYYSKVSRSLKNLKERKLVENHTADMARSLRALSFCCLDFIRL